MRAVITAATAVALATAALLSACAALSPLEADAAAPWWQPVGLQGVSLRDVAAQDKTIVVRTASQTTLRSVDAGVTFSPVAGNPPVERSAVLVSGNTRWAINPDGAVLHGDAAGDLRPDPHAPSLGASARLIAAPAVYPGVVAAVSRDGTVWRRAQDGTWARALLLLPAGFPAGVPVITDVAAFSQPLSGTLYLSTDGYSVLNSTDGGDDWFRAGPGLPDSVYALAADSTAKAVYAATSDGLWMHRLRSIPAPPVYRDAALTGRWVGTGAVTLVVALLGLVALRRVTATARP